ncbi:MAG: (Fe-S)-binding protein, partial [Clostridia bacterium]|nr:(Fe-S)-binding protein [Clostridia bacterium]
SLLLACCGVPAYWAGNAQEEQAVAARLSEVWRSMGCPKVITACPSCGKQLAKMCSEWECVSLYEILADSPFAAHAQGMQAAVFDPCAAKELQRVKESVRKIAQRSGFSLKPSPKESCCGNGGHMRAVTPELFNQIAENSAFSSTEDAITYCANCRDIFASRGKRAIHILDLFCEGSPENAFCRPAPSWGERRRNRELLKASFTNMPPPSDDTKLLVSQALMAKLHNELLTEQEILKTIQNCEVSGTKLTYAGSDIYIGHMRLGAITIWVEYRVVDGGYELLNAYFHRMDITEGVPDGVK